MSRTMHFKGLPGVQDGRTACGRAIFGSGMRTTANPDMVTCAACVLTGWYEVRKCAVNNERNRATAQGQGGSTPKLRRT